MLVILHVQCSHCVRAALSCFSVLNKRCNKRTVIVETELEDFDAG